MSQQHWTEPHHQFWYKVRWRYHCPNAQHEPVGLMLSHLNMAGKIYLNQDLLWTDHALQEPLSRSWNTPRIWTIPASAVLSEDNYIWIYLVSSPTQKANLGRVEINHLSEIDPAYLEARFEQRTLLVISITINLIVGIFYFLAWLIQRTEKALLFVTLMLVLWICYNLLFIMQSSLISSGFHERLMSWVFTSYTFFKCIALWRFANLRFAKTEIGLLSIWIILTGLIWLAPLAHIQPYLSVILLINLVVFIAQHVSYPFLVYKCGKIDVYILAVLQIANVPVAVHDAYFFMVNQHNFWSPYISPFSALFIGFILALRLYHNRRMIESFNQQLQDKITHALQEREVILNTQHAIELENTKLQERIDLAHDLHDSLGGSLVRSMAIVDQSAKNLSNQQFLSMLKIFRNDLRQIIDTGSSLGNSPPESPKIWGAALRYRFSQIFDELNIKSSWRFCEEWQHMPSTIECLSFYRVLEESLTNIIKHSQAQHVEVELYYNEFQQLVLSVCDDGIGFDAEAVFSAGLSIGLRSIQLRLDKIGASLTIQSQPGKTQILVVSKAIAVKSS